MDFFSETKFNAPIKGQNNESGKPELNILGGVKVSNGCGEALIILDPALDPQNVTINGNLTIYRPAGGGDPTLSIDSTDHRIDVGGEIWSTKIIKTSDSIEADGNISACGNIIACGGIAAHGTIIAKNITGECSINTGGNINANGTISGMAITTSGTITGGTINTNDLTASGNIDGGIVHASGDITAGGDIIGGTINAQNSIRLAGETITSWAELKGPAGPSIQRFTSPEVPANCSQFYFEGCNLVTGSELPFIQVRETATGKLVQMDVWVNLDGCCSGYTVGKPVAKIEPCSTATEAGAWTAIVMN